MIVKKQNASNSLSIVFAIAFFFASLSYTPIFGQESVLRDRIETVKDTALVNAYLELAKYYYKTTGKGDSLIVYAQKALQLSRNLNNDSKEIKALIYLGTGYLVLEEYKKSESYFKKGLKKATRKNDFRMQADFYNKLGSLYQNQGRLVLAIDNLLKSASYFQKTSDFGNIADAYYGIALIYAQQNQYKKQLKYITQAVELIETNNIQDPFKENYIYGFASQHYLELSKIFPGEGYLKHAKKYAEKALTIADENNFASRKPASFNILSGYYLQNKDYAKAKFYAKKVSEYRKYANESILIDVFMRLGEINMKLNQENITFSYIDSLNTLKIKNEDYYAAQVANFIYKANKHYGNYSKALNALEEKNKFDNAFKEKNQTKLIEELETKYRTELKDAEIENLNQQQQIDALEIKNKRSQIYWLLILVSLVSLIGIIIFFIYQQRALKNKMRLITTEQRLNRARINPHFFFNAMASLQSFANKENSPKTSAFLSRFAKIMRQSLESTYTELVTIEKEIEFVTQYLETQKLLYPDKFNYKIEYEDTLEVNELKVPGMLLQPFLENAIEHGFKNIDYKGEVVVNLKESPNEICITISDNGMNLNESKHTKEYPSRAMQIIQDRLSLFNKQQKYNARFEMLNLKETSGFEIAIYLPKLYLT